MVQFYVVQIKLGRITITDVPARWRADAEAALMAE